jgi:hypothetical protein
MQLAKLTYRRSGAARRYRQSHLLSWTTRVVPEVSRNMGQRHPPSATTRGWFQRFPETWGNGIRHPRPRGWFQRFPETRCLRRQREPVTATTRGWFQRLPETWGNGIRHPGCLRRQREPVTATTARNRTSWSGPGQKLMWSSRGLPSMADAGQTFPLAAPAAVPSASRWPAPVRPGH